MLAMARAVAVLGASTGAAVACLSGKSEKLSASDSVIGRPPWRRVSGGRHTGLLALHCDT